MLSTPGQLDRFAGFYHQLAQMVQAGIGLPQALETLRNSARSRASRRALTTVLDELRRGGTLSEALGATGRWLPRFDVALLAAGEQSGRLDACCQILSDYHRERAATIREILHQLGWPLLTLFVAFLIFPVDRLVGLFLCGDVAGFLIPKLEQLGIAALLVWGFLYLNQSRRGEGLRAVIERVTLPVPLLGKARRAGALARVTLALEALLNAGVNLVTAWEMAADASGSPRLKRAVRQACRDITAGATPSEALQRTGVFPEEFLAYYGSGEQSGRLDENLRYLQRHYRDEARRLTRGLCVWIPRILYLLILVIVGMSVISFWTGYYDQILNQP